MNVVGHWIDLYDFLSPIGNNAGDVSVKFLFVVFWNKRLSTLNSEYDMDVELGICICHRSSLSLKYPKFLPIEIPKVPSQLECSIFAPAERYVYRKMFVLSSAPAERYVKALWAVRI